MKTILLVVCLFAGILFGLPLLVQSVVDSYEKDLPPDVTPVIVGKKPRPELAPVKNANEPAILEDIDEDNLPKDNLPKVVPQIAIATAD